MTAASVIQLDPGHVDDVAQECDAGVKSSMQAARALVHECVANHPEFDANEIADHLLAEGLPAAAHAYVLREGLIGIAGHIRRTQRRPHIERPVPDKDSEANYSARWANVERCADVFQQHWPHPSGRTVMLGDFTRSDAEWAVEYFRKIASGATDRAERFERLARILPKNGKPAHSLPRDQVEAIFDA